MIQFPKSNKKGFTLIELLVVVAIFGLLTSIVLVAIKGVKEKSIMARALNFNAQIYHYLGAYSAGIWDFNEGSGGIATDTSGNGNDGTINGASWTTDTPSGTGYALSFDGDGDYVDIPDYLFTEDTTVSLWVKRAEEGETREHLFGHDTFFIHSDTYIRARPHGWLNWIGISTNLSTNWNHIVFVAENMTTIRLYVNGIDEGARSDPLDINETLMYIGAPGIYSPNNTIDEVRIYEQVLSSTQIKKLYAEGLAKKEIAAK